MAITTLLAALTLSAPVGDRLLIVATPSSQDWAQLANHYMEMGEQRAIEGLIERSRRPDQEGTEMNINARTALMARLLFERDGKSPLKGPTLGEELWLVWDNTWPMFPFFQQDGVLFLGLDRMPTKAEKTEDYIAYLKLNGKFRKTPYKVPSETEAKKALGGLFASTQWKGVRWPNQQRPIDPKRVKVFLTKQTKQPEF